MYTRIEVRINLFIWKRIEEPTLPFPGGANLIRKLRRFMFSLFPSITGLNPLASDGTPHLSYTLASISISSLEFAIPDNSTPPFPLPFSPSSFLYILDIILLQQNNKNNFFKQILFQQFCVQVQTNRKKWSIDLSDLDATCFVFAVLYKFKK